MSIAQAEELKSRFTDKYVVVQDGVPELRRFSGLTGTVKTVNMNCRALVQFDGPADIAWYDIDPSYLKVVDAPLPKKKAEGHAPKAEVAAKPAVVKPAADKSVAAKPAAAGGKSPLELARAQAAAKAAGGAAPATAPASGEKKLSPLELARQQGAAKAKPAADKPVESAASPAVAPAPAEPAPAPATVPKASGAAPAKPGSTAEILALARQQGAVKK